MNKTEEIRIVKFMEGTLADHIDESGDYYCGDSVKIMLQQYANDMVIKQRLRDRAVYSINRGKTPIEIKQALLDAPLVTE